MPASHNFVGRPVRGYLAAECILSEPAANALETVQRMLADKKLSLIVWDCYRPKRAVDDFVQWSKDPSRSEMKAEFYPRTDKAKLFALGYLARRSAHSRGSTVDLGIVPTAFRPRLQIPRNLSRHARLQRARDSRTELSILARATTVWTCLQIRQTSLSARLHDATVKH